MLVYRMGCLYTDGVLEYGMGCSYKGWGVRIEDGVFLYRMGC